MDRKLTGTLLGVAGAVLWFLPLANVHFMGVEGVQSGQHVGGAAYLMLLASLSYAVLSWKDEHVPRIIAASIALAISLLIFASAGTSEGTSAAWGLYCLVLVNAASIVMAVADNKHAKRSSLRTAI